MDENAAAQLLENAEPIDKIRAGIVTTYLYGGGNLGRLKPTAREIVRVLRRYEETGVLSRPALVGDDLIAFMDGRVELL